MGLSQNFLEDTYRLLTCSSDPPSSRTRLELEQLLRIAVQNLSLGLLVLCQAPDSAQDDRTLASTSTLTPVFSKEGLKKDAHVAARLGH